MESTAGQLERATVGIESRYVLQGNDHRFPVSIPRDATLEVSLGIPQQLPSEPPTVIEASVTFETADRRVQLLRRTIGGPEGRMAPKEWYDFALPLLGFAGQQGTIALTLRTVDGTAVPNRLVLWGDPTLVPGDTGSGTNIILISIDTLRADRLGCYGSERETSPNIDRMAKEGVLFRHAVSSSSWTLPAHASMLTGLDPYFHGSIRYGKATPLREDLDTLAEHFWRGNVETAGFVGGGFVDAAMGFGQGFDRYWSRARQSFDSFDDNAGAAMRWMDKHIDRPFFVFLHTYQVHTPYVPPPPYDRMFDPDYDGPLRERIMSNDTPKLLASPRLLQHARALYDGLVRYTDRGIGDLLDHLAATGLARNTCVILTSDHGEEFLEHGDVMHARAKLYSELVHVPLIVWCPSRIGGGREVQDVVSLVDVTPTALDLAGLPLPTAIQGRSLVDLLQGRPGAPARVVVSETDASVEGSSGTILALTTDRYRMIDSSVKQVQPRQLFDLVDDPAERSNLYSTRPDLVQRLAAVLKDTLAARKDPPVTAPQPSYLDPEVRERLRALGYGEH